MSHAGNSHKNRPKEGKNAFENTDSHRRLFGKQKTTTYIIIS